MLFNELFKNYLKINNYLDDTEIEEVYKIAIDKSTPLYVELYKNNYLKEEETYHYVADFFKLEYRNCQVSELDFELLAKFPREKLLEYEALPFQERDKDIIFITSNPFKLEEINEFKFYIKKQVKIELVTYSNMKNLLEYFDNKYQQSQVLDDYTTNNKDLTDVNDDVAVNAPIITLCDSILKDAVTRGASDIHIEPLSENVKIRFRIDGMLSKVNELTTDIYPAVLARFKIMAGLNIAERRVPQDGKINLSFNETKYDFRVSTIPTIHGEKIVIRIYILNLAETDFDKLGFDTKEEEIVKKMITRPHGIILLTGPTGSGKSTTLYSFLHYLNDDARNIITVEDPVENEITGINQVQVNPKANLTFATALRSILRQDPNVIMIGEIRDEETAQIATRAAITGHLVLSTIHTNNVAGVVTRLINMGIPRYLVADSLIGAISQRLVRKLCPKCKKEHLTTEAENKLLGLDESVMIYEKTGCPHCNNSGYLGRIGVFEMMVIDDDIRNLIMDNDFTSERLLDLLKTKEEDILDNTKKRVLAGITSIEEYESLTDIIE